jgi:hypothetical protein
VGFLRIPPPIKLTVSYCGEPKTWIEAKTFCEVKGGRLMNRGTENDAVFLQRTDIPAYQEIWLGQYKGLSGWATLTCSQPINLLTCETH